MDEVRIHDENSIEGSMEEILVASNTCTMLRNSWQCRHMELSSAAECSLLRQFSHFGSTNVPWEVDNAGAYADSIGCCVVFILYLCFDEGMSFLGH